jgi:hypothetical protein
MTKARQNVMRQRIFRSREDQATGSAATSELSRDNIHTSVF